MVGERRIAREIALLGLYMYEFTDKNLEKVLSFSWLDESIYHEISLTKEERDKEDDNLENFDRTISDIREKIDSEILDFAKTLINGTIENLTKIDEIIEKYSKNWSIERLGLVDKIVIRLSVYAMLYIKNIPAAVTINEGIELGKTFCGDQAGNFINGILDAIQKNELS